MLGENSMDVKGLKQYTPADKKSFMRLSVSSRVIAFLLSVNCRVRVQNVASKRERESDRIQGEGEGEVAEAAANMVGRYDLFTLLSVIRDCVYRRRRE